MLALENP